MWTLDNTTETNNKYTASCVGRDAYGLKNLISFQLMLSPLWKNG